MSRCWVLLCFLFCLPVAVAAQDRRPSHCIAIADSAPGMQYLHRVADRPVDRPVVRAGWNDPVAEYAVRIEYIAHASFLIRTHDGLNMVTDFTGFVGNVDMIPDVVTMNHAHSTHWTAYPDPAIPHVLPGWGPFGQGITHHLDLGEVLVRNVSTDIRSEFSGVEPRGNSVFVFEVAGLCIGHLGHLHHVPTDAQFAAIGRLDVVMAPVDGGMTLPLGDMMMVLRRLKSSVVIPMHWFGYYTLDAFLAGMADTFAIEFPGTSGLEMSLRDLPDRPTIVVLEPRFLDDPGE